MKYSPDIHHRRSIRLQGYDYTQPGAYFVTLVTYQHDKIFGEISGDGLGFSPLGKIVRDEWFQSSAIRREIRLFEDEFVVMPNHVHGIIWVVGADGVRPRTVGVNGVNPGLGKGAHRAPLRRVPRSLGSFVAGFKASVTSRAMRELNLTEVWQRNYYEHIIRNEKELKNIWDYIDSNPLHWEDDQLHPSAPSNKFDQG